MSPPTLLAVFLAIFLINLDTQILDVDIVFLVFDIYHIKCLLLDFQHMPNSGGFSQNLIP